MSVCVNFEFNAMQLIERKRKEGHINQSIILFEIMAQIKEATALTEAMLTINMTSRTYMYVCKC